MVRAPVTSAEARDGCAFDDLPRIAQDVTTVGRLFLPKHQTGRGFGPGIFQGVAMKCAARFARKIAAWVSETQPAVKSGESEPAQTTTPKSNGVGCNGAPIMAGSSFPRNTDTPTTRDWIFRRAPKATDKRHIQAYHETHARLRAEMIRKGG